MAMGGWFVLVPCWGGGIALVWRVR